MTPTAGAGGLLTVVGMLRVTQSGTKNCPSLTGALQVNEPVNVTLPVLLTESPVTLTYELGSPPVHSTVTPCVRSRFPETESIFAKIIGGSGKVTLAVKGGTSAPPGPLSAVINPGMRNKLSVGVVPVNANDDPRLPL